MLIHHHHYCVLGYPPPSTTKPSCHISMSHIQALHCTINHQQTNCKDPSSNEHKARIYLQPCRNLYSTVDTCSHCQQKHINPSILVCYKGKMFKYTIMHAPRAQPTPSKQTNQRTHTHTHTCPSIHTHTHTHTHTSTSTHQVQANI